MVLDGPTLLAWSAGGQHQAAVLQYNISPLLSTLLQSAHLALEAVQVVVLAKRSQLPHFGFSFFGNNHLAATPTDRTEPPD